MLAATVADLAALLKHSAPMASRGVSLEDVGLRAAALEADGVEGADELVSMIDLAAAAR
jgi:hypothetical protein